MKLSVFYTNDCNILCEHCFLGRITEKHFMRNELLKNVLSQAIECDIDVISFTGGEPLLYWDNISKELNVGLLNNIKLTISTNGFWARNEDSTKKMMEKLKSKNIKQIELSYDEYHAKFIPIENIYNIIDIAKIYNIVVKIIMSVSNELSYLVLYSKLLKYICAENIIIQKVAKFGNANNNAISSFQDIKQCIGVRCEQIMNPCVTYTGDVFACCGPCVVSGTNNILYISNLNNERLDSIINKMLRDSKLRAIHKYGPSVLLKKDYIKKCSSLCDICMNKF